MIMKRFNMISLKKMLKYQLSTLKISRLKFKTKKIMIMNKISTLKKMFAILLLVSIWKLITQAY